ncbi:MAG: pitrilysin family protein [Bacteroidales bacterium]|nr:pitrilysin family protein [Bacteroidales bacterium]MDT8372665.1 pitrilysin family protein [Bacteroidales bacterium]
MKDALPLRAPALNIPSPGDTSFPACTRLSNGVPVYLIGNGPEGLIRIEFVFNAGQRTESVHLASAATNTMLTEGTYLHDAASVNNLIDATGALFSPNADKDSAGLVTVTLTRKLDEVMSLAEEVLFHPSFPEREFRMMKDKRMQAFLIGRQRTAVRAREEFYRALCGDETPYGRVTCAEDYASLSVSHLQDFHSTHYIPRNMYITVAGRNPEQALPLLERHFSGEGSGPWSKPVITVPLFSSASPGVIYCEVKDSVQSTVRMGWKGITRDHPDYLGLQVATMLLGGYFGSRLMRKIREEKGYTYGIHAVAGAFHGIGYIAVMTDVANAWREETVMEIRKEIARLQRDDVSDDELQVVRNHTMGEIARLFDGPFSVADAIKGIVDYDAGHDYYTRFAETVNNITPGKIKELFNTYFNQEEAYVIIAGTA